MTRTWILLAAVLACESSAKSSDDAGSTMRDAEIMPDAVAPGVATTVHSSLTYGKSERGQTLGYEELVPPDANGKRALLTFGVHGFEDAWPHDGYALYAIATRLVAHFGVASGLAGWTVDIVPTANPDGLRFGVNNFREGTAGANGRCTSAGKDINRNFSTARFAEHDALQALVDELKPTLIVDFHGWYNCYYGVTKIGDFFARSFNAKYEGKPSRYCYVNSNGAMDCGDSLGGVFHKNATIGSDLFAEWATSKRRIPAVLVEYPAPDFDRDGKYDTSRDTGLDYDQITPATLDMLVERTRIALDDLFANY